MAFIFIIKMADIYKYNPKAHYTPSMSSGGISLDKYMIYIDEHQYISLDFPDVFKDYKIVVNKDAWKLGMNLFNELHRRPPRLDEYFKFYRCQLKFALYCSTSALGISRSI